MKKTVSYLAAFCVIALVSNVASAGFVSDNEYITGFDAAPFPDYHTNASGIESWSTIGSAWANINLLPYAGTACLETVNIHGGVSGLVRHVLNAPTGDNAYFDARISGHRDWTGGKSTFRIYEASGGDTTLFQFVDAGNAIEVNDGGTYTALTPTWTKMLTSGTPADYYDHYRIEMDFAADTWEMWINGSYQGEFDLEVGRSDLEKIAFVSYNGGVNGFTIDNLAYGNIPEPVTLAVLAIGGLAGLLRRRR